MTKINILGLAKRYLSPAASDKDKMDFEAVLNGLAEKGKEPDKEIISQSEKTIFNRIKISRQKRDRKRMMVITAKFAASVLIICALPLLYLLQQKSTDVTLVKETGGGMRSTIRLADGSMVWLNENSKLVYREVYAPNVRMVKLHGEAFFDIQADSDRPFKVVSDDSEVTVLGTSFNINTLRGTEITVTTGQVKVANTQTWEEVYLEEGQQAVLDQEATKVTRVDPELYISWHTKTLNFKDEPIEKVFSLLERVYGVKIHIRSKLSDNPCLITGFYKEEKIETIIRGLTTLIDFDYSIDPSTKTITIDLDQCKQ